MREIKFRAWINKISVYAENVIINSDGGYIAYKNGTQYINCEIEQYTGLKDKNGKEVYEGDIIQNDNEDFGYIGFENGAFYVTIDGGTDLYKYFYRHCEVISNIHENPELLS